MNKIELQKHIEEPWGSTDFKKFGAQLALQEGHVSILLELTQSDNKKIAWRSAYLIDIINQTNNNLLNNHIETICNRISTEKEQGVLRHFTRILMTRNSSDYADGLLIDSCINHLMERKTAIAVKANILSIMQQLLETYPELKNEMDSVFEVVKQDSSPGIRSRFRKIIGTDE